jgi:hypothetical protein
VHFLVLTFLNAKSGTTAALARQYLGFVPYRSCRGNSKSPFSPCRQDVSVLVLIEAKE